MILMDILEKITAKMKKKIHCSNIKDLTKKNYAKNYAKNKC
jgi:hypothetical protein